MSPRRRRKASPRQYSTTADRSFSSSPPLVSSDDSLTSRKTSMGVAQLSRRRASLRLSMVWITWKSRAAGLVLLLWSLPMK